jgi:hypothetical protein
MSNLGNKETKCSAINIKNFAHNDKIKKNHEKLPGYLKNKQRSELEKRTKK